MNNWQTMDKAPISNNAFLSDVKPCLVFGPEIGVKIGRAWRYPDGEARADAGGFHGNWLITHWQPLPQPPSTPEKAE